ncbi:MAG: biotin/lipoyl-binding protein [Prevotella sp.]|nr:biotin/lipoyl-binding protein [Prevotella sp.]
MNKYQYKVQGIDYEVEIVDVDGNIAKVNVNGIPFEVEMKEPIHSAASQNKPKVAVHVPAPNATAQPTPAVQPAQKPAEGEGTKVTAPLPGTITEIRVNVGDTVKQGKCVVVLEAMKMQNKIEAECDGTITSINVSKGDAVMEGDTLVVIG